jgi:hypothetical protein
VPRKYHRPPDTTTKRRKPRKTAIPYEFTSEPEVAANGDEAADDVEGWEADSAVAVDVRRAPVAPTPVRDAHGRLERHVNRDYGYVQGEVIRIVAIAGFLIIALIITSFFR